MSAKLTKAYITAQHRVEDVLARRESGQGALEYIGILVIVVLAMGFVYTAVNGEKGTIETAVKDVIAKLVGGGK